MMSENLYRNQEYPIYTGPLHMCCYCKMMFISEAFLTKHQKKCYHLKLFTILKSKLQLNRNRSNEDIEHTKKNVNENQTWEDYFCEECFCGFLELTDYESHMRDHHPFHCDLCDRNFLNNGKLQSHLAMIHEKEKQFSCDFCPKLFKKKSDFERHNRRYTGDLPFVCPKCSKKYASKTILKRHLVTHSGENPFGCDQCEKRFSNRFNLTQHLRTHSRERPFGCDICEKRFSRKEHLKRHMVTHSQIKPFGCNLCEKSFSREDYLKIHLMIHSGEKPFRCDYCEKKFLRKDHLKTHLLMIHSGKIPNDPRHSSLKTN